MTDWRRSPALPRGFSREARVYMRPVGLLSGDSAVAAVEAGAARCLVGGRFAFSACEVLVREPHAVTATISPIGEVADWADSHAARLLENLSTPRTPIAGVAMDRPAIMGVINVTPDSFSDGGDNAEAETAIAHGHAQAEAGAAFLDIGGESTRPGSDAVDDETELARVLPVVRGLAAVGVPLSIDSRRARVMAAALEAGATVVNDVSALTYDGDSLATVAAGGDPVVLMHTLGDPKTMQRDPRYDCAPLDVYDYLEERIEACIAAGIERDRIVIDPGIGFGKSPLGHNIEILQRLGLFHGLGCALLLGVSRKSFIGRLTGAEAPKDRLAGSLAAGLATLDQGVQILRVHDVAETKQAVAVWDALTAPGDCR